MTADAARPPRWWLARGLAVAFGCGGFWIAVVMLLALPAIHFVANRLGHQRARREPWWPIMSWAYVIGLLPKMAQNLERWLVPQPASSKE